MLHMLFLSWSEIRLANSSAQMPLREYAKFRLSLSVFSAAAVSSPPQFASTERGRTGEHAKRADVADGQITQRSCPALLAKTISFPLGANHFISAAVSSHQEGRLAIVTNAGRDAMDADVLLTNGTEADGEVVWF
jgi:hypothetical protein